MYSFSSRSKTSTFSANMSVRCSASKHIQDAYYPPCPEASTRSGRLAEEDRLVGLADEPLVHHLARSAQTVVVEEWHCRRHHILRPLRQHIRRGMRCRASSSHQLIAVGSQELPKQAPIVFALVMTFGASPGKTRSGLVELLRGLRAGCCCKPWCFL